MWNYLKKWFEKIPKSNPNTNQKNKETFVDDINQNKSLLLAAFKNVEDIKLRNIELNNESNHKLKITLVYISNLVDKDKINDAILNPLLSLNTEPLDNAKLNIKTITNKIINSDNIKKVSIVEKGINEVLKGNCLLLIDETRYSLSISVQGWKERTISKPITERTIRGASDAFMENIDTNTGLVRRRIKNRHLKIESFTKGKYTQTKIRVMYIEGIANSKIVREVKKRLKNINTGQIISSRHILELIEDNPLSIFETIYETERPDVASAGILEGRVLILVDGSPSALITPMLFMENLVSAEDYYTNFYYTFLARIIRFLGFLVSILLPAIYISSISFHQEILPMTLVNTIYAAREGVPFPIAIEIIIFGLFFEGIREAVARIPQSLGSSVTIVGALILGDAAIQAGILGPDSVIIGSLTGISTFVLPTVEFNNTLLSIRFLFTIASAISGFYGLTIAILLATAHLVSLRSFGVPYMSPLAPLQLSDLKDFFMRVPYLLMNTRPQSLENENTIRQGNNPAKRYFFKYKFPNKD